MIYTFIAICLFGGALAEVPTGQCRKVDRMQDFNKTAFFGTWYEVASSNRSHEFPCYSIDLFVNDGEDYAEHVWLNQKLWKSFYDPDVEINIDDDSFSSSQNSAADLKLHEHVLATDYTSYAIFYFCVDNKPVVSMFARDFSPDKKVLQNVNQIIKKNNLADVEVFPQNLEKCKPTTTSSSQEK